MRKRIYFDANGNPISKQELYARTSFAPNHKYRWSAEETELVMTSSKPDEEIAKMLGRSMMAVQCHRHFTNKKNIRNEH